MRKLVPLAVALLAGAACGSITDPATRSADQAQLDGIVGGSGHRATGMAGGGHRDIGTAGSGLRAGGMGGSGYAKETETAGSGFRTEEGEKPTTEEIGTTGGHLAESDGTSEPGRGIMADSGQ
jgi:hypothetical protein